MKKFIIGLVLGVAISASGSVYALTKPASVPKAVVNTQNMSVLEAGTAGVAKVGEFDSKTGKRLTQAEKRLREMEARISALEAKIQ